MKEFYDYKKIEQEVQDRWDQQKPYEANIDTKKLENEIVDQRKKGKKVKLVLKNSRYGPFYSCSNWKRDKSGCNHTEKV